MRLLHTTALRIEQFIEHKRDAALVSSERDAVPEYAVPRYAILSHTWEDDEVLFEDMHGDRAAATGKVGYKKITQSCLQARFDGYDWIWIDTCCIDKTSSAELSEAINSMFRWYQNSSVCYVYLADAEGTQPIYQSDDPMSRFWHVLPRWYSRGWTLQELIAPSNVVFFSRDWKFIGTKEQHMHQISTVTGVDHYALSGENLARMSVARRMTWLAKRETTRAEDIAYCMLGIFGINMPLQYGEGPNAFVRLQEEIVKGTEDQSIFAWVEDDSLDYYREDYGNSFERHGLLAGSPHLFRTSSSIIMIPWDRPSRPHSVLTRQGLSIHVLLCRDVSYLSGEVYLAVLDCQIGRVPGVFAGIRLRRVDPSGEHYVRVDIAHLFQFACLRPDGTIETEGFDPTTNQKELFDLRLRTSHKDWKPGWVYVAQAPLSPLPPGFWVLPYNTNIISIDEVYPYELWDKTTQILQPLRESILPAKVGAFRIQVGPRYTQKSAILLFGLLQNPLGTQPWCTLFERDNSQPLSVIFESYRFVLPPKKDPRTDGEKDTTNASMEFTMTKDILVTAWFELRATTNSQLVSTTKFCTIQLTATKMDAS